MSNKAGVNWLLCLFIFINFLAKSIFAQNLFESKIRSIYPVKKNVYLREGTFYKKANKQVENDQLKNIRRSYFKAEKRERVVFDFSNSSIPQTYIYISKENKKIYFDFFNLKVNDGPQTHGSGFFLKKINFYPIEEQMLSIEFELSQALSYDIFYLENPGRLVIDIKEN